MDNNGANIQGNVSLASAYVSPALYHPACGCMRVARGLCHDRRGPTRPAPHIPPPHAPRPLWVRMTMAQHGGGEEVGDRLVRKLLRSVLAAYPTCRDASGSHGGGGSATGRLQGVWRGTRHTGAREPLTPHPRATTLRVRLAVACGLHVRG